MSGLCRIEDHGSKTLYDNLKTNETQFQWSEKRKYTIYNISESDKHIICWKMVKIYGILPDTVYQLPEII